MADRPENVPEQFWNAEAGAVNTDALLTAYGEATKPAARPEGLADPFWDSEKNAVKFDDLLKSHNEMNAKLNPPELTPEQKNAKEAADAEAATKAQADLFASYGDFKLPEGFEANPDGMKAAKEFFAKQGISKDASQGLIDLFAKEMADGVKAVHDANTKAWDDLQTEWKGAIEKDPDYGGEKLAPTRASIDKVMDTFGDPELRDALKITGANNNPKVFRFLAKVASRLTEGNLIQGGGGPAGEKKSLAERMYPDGGNNNLGGRPPQEKTDT